ncbi:MAG TPA: helix-turn-helix transcriptional regulator [Gemmatimonadales bacterium]
MTPIVLRLKELREVRGWSQSELARRSGVHQSIISRLESGDTLSVSFPNLERLGRALGCDPGYLIVRTARGGPLARRNPPRRGVRTPK